MKNLKVRCKHRDGWSWTLVVHELIEAIILDKSQFSEDGRTYTIIGWTDDKPTHSCLGASKIVDQRFKNAIAGNYAEEVA